MANTDVSVLAFGREMIHDEARALDALADALGDDFERAVATDPRPCRQTDRLRARASRAISAARSPRPSPRPAPPRPSFISPRRSTATSASPPPATSPAHFAKRATAELEPVIDHFSGGRHPDHRHHRQSGARCWPKRPRRRLILPHWPEVGPEAVAPTTSTTMTLALGDALAMTVMREKGFTRTDFGRLHPGGSLGARLKPVVG